MIDSKKMGRFIVEKRKALGLTQTQLSEKLNVSFQAISKWENGVTFPNIEILKELASVLEVTVDEILAGSEKEESGLSYSKAGIDIAYTDSIKKEMEKSLETKDPRVLNGLGPFASLYDINFPEIKDPVLVLKTEEPGSKQKLAMEYGYTESICHDMINHLVNDIIVMGARPLAAGQGRGRCLPRELLFSCRRRDLYPASRCRPRSLCPFIKHCGHSRKIEDH